MENYPPLGVISHPNRQFLGHGQPAICVCPAVTRTCALCSGSTTTTTSSSARSTLAYWTWWRSRSPRPRPATTNSSWNRSGSTRRGGVGRGLAKGGGTRRAGVGRRLVELGSAGVDQGLRTRPGRERRAPTINCLSLTTQEFHCRSAVIAVLL